MPARLSSAVRALVAPVLARPPRRCRGVPCRRADPDGRRRQRRHQLLARLPLTSARMSKSLDAAGLAAGRKALDDDAEEIAGAYFDANFGENLGDIELTDFPVRARRRGCATSPSRPRRRMPTYFMRVFGHDEMNVSARTVIERQTTGMELALVMDNTGSMWKQRHRDQLAGTPFAAMRDAALRPRRHHLRRGGRTRQRLGEPRSRRRRGQHRPLPHRLARREQHPDQGVNGPQRLHSLPPPAATGGDWKGCVMARAHPWDTDNSTPSEHPFRSFFYPKTSTRDNNYTWTTINDSPYRHQPGPERDANLGCGTPITPLTKSRARSTPGSTRCGRGGAAAPPATSGSSGDGGRSRRPDWRGLWGDADLPLDYGTDFMDKVVVHPDRRQQRVLQPSRWLGRRPRRTPSDFTAYGRVNAPGPVGLALVDHGQRRHHPQQPDDGDLHRDEGGEGQESTRSSSAALRTPPRRRSTTACATKPVDVLLCAEQRRARQAPSPASAASSPTC